MKRKFTKVFSILLCVAMLAATAVGCANNQSTSSSSGSAEGSSETSAEGSSSEETPAEQSNIVFWYHDGNTVSNGIFEELVARFEEENPQYTVEYVGLPNDSYLQKYNTAIATNTVPDVASIRDMDMSAFISQNALMALDDTFEAWEEKDNILPAALETVRSTAPDGKLYCLPEYVTMDISWCNTTLLEEKGLEPPKTIDEFMQYCEDLADPTNGTYFFSLRGGAGSMEALFDFLFTYAGEDSLFDEEGNCVINGDKFVEGLELYASIYWNGWTSNDSVTNDFKKIVAEFGSGTSMYIMHNSSSLPEHQKNLGEGNFTNVLAPANENGEVVTKALSFCGFGMFNASQNVEGAKALTTYLCSADAASYHCEIEGRIPVNTGIYDDEWYQNDPCIGVYQEMMENENVKWLEHAIWLPSWNEFRSKLQEPDLQAVLLKEKTAKEVLDSWAEYLTAAQKEYLASNG